MSFYSGGLRRDEQVSYFLRGLFESRGYKRYKAGGFEEYGLYLENRNFLPSGRVVTFNAPDGRLLALRPDVTLSIAKSTNASRTRSEKLYYIENVCRLSRRSREYEEINQMGLEYFGCVDDFATSEVIRLALRSLAAIDSEFVLDVSHMGFVGGLLDSLPLDTAARTSLLDCIRSKNRHDLEKTALSLGVPEADAVRLSRTAGLYGDFDACLAEAADIAGDNASMRDAVEQLSRLSRLTEGFSAAKSLRLDFSIVNDIDYYNGVIFQGYVKRVPYAVLAGGRYDNLLARFGRNAGAIGFALYLNEISARYTKPEGFDVDAFILYGEDADLAALTRAVDALADSGKRVRAERYAPESLRCAHVYRFENGELREVSADA